MRDSFWDFLKAFTYNWWVTASGALSVPFTFAGAILEGWGRYLTLALAATSFIAGSFFVWRQERRKAEALDAHDLDRAYLVGGGECQIVNGQVQRDNAGHRLFRLELGNHGKTLGRLEEYEIGFCTQAEAMGQQRPNLTRQTHHDQFPPGERHRPVGPLIPITRNDADVVFGTLYYKDLWDDDHYYRFILRIARNGHTYSDMKNVDTYRGQA
jgi:hypothetical protein